MIFMYLYDLPNATTGFDNVLVELVSTVPEFIPLTLMFIFFVIWLGGISRQKARSGTADYSLWAVVASISTLLVALILSIASGLMNVVWLSVVIVVAIFSSIWFFLDRKSSEV